MPRPIRRPKQIKVSLSTEVYETIVRMAELNEMSISACVADMLEALHPNLKHTLMMLEEARKLDTKAKNNLAKALERHEQQLRQAVEYVLENTANEVKQHKLPL